MKKRVRIPTSELGANGEVGTVVSETREKITVDFDGKVGIYTLSKHVVEEVRE